MAFDAAFTLIMMASAFGEDVPFAAPPPSAPGQLDTPDMAGLGSIMSITVLQHIETYHAGIEQLVVGEIYKINDSLSKVSL